MLSAPSTVRCHRFSLRLSTHFCNNRADRAARRPKRHRMNLNDFLSQIQNGPNQDGPSKVSQATWDRLAEYLQAHPDEKKEAFTRIEQILNDDGNAAPAYANWIFALYQKADPAEAVQTAERADKRYPGKREIRILWGMALRKAGDIDDAIAKYELLGNQDFDALYNSGNALLSRNDFSRSIAKYKQAKRAAKNRKNTAKACYAVAFAQQKAGLLKQAIGEFGRASEAVEPGDRLVRDIYFGWSKALLDLNKPKQAAEKYEALEKICPNDEVVLYNWGVALQQAKELESAADKYKRATENKRDYAEAYYNWGVVCHELRDWKGAAEKYELATQGNKKDADAYYNWGLALLNLEEWNKASAKFDLATEYKPEYADAYANNAWSLLQSESFDKAIAKSKDAIRFYDQTNDAVGKATALYYLGRAYEKDSPSKAKEQYKAATDVDLGQVDALFAWGNLLAKENDEEGALERFYLATERRPDFAFAWHNIADLYHQQGQYQLSGETWLKALAAYEQTTTNGENQCNSYFYYALATVQYEFLRDLSGARKNFLKACELNPKFPGPRIGLARLYLDLANGDSDRSEDWEDQQGRFRPDWRARYAASAAEEFLKADDLLEQVCKNSSKERMPYNLVQRGELHLTMKKFDSAEQYLKKALPPNPKEASLPDSTYCRIRTELGMLCCLKRKSAKAIEHFREAHLLKPRDLNLHSYLADAYQMHGWLEKAEQEYNRILDATVGHVEAHIGLGETFMSLAEAGDNDLYADAVDCFGRAIRLSNTKLGSRQLANHELAAVHYNRGVARTKLWENSRAAKRSLLHQARDDFETACQLDSENYQAARARKRLKDTHLAVRPARVGKWLGPILIFLLSGIVFLLSQITFFLGGHEFSFSLLGHKFLSWTVPKLETASYVTLSFGMLAFMVIGLYLPQLLKLEVGAVKFEKSVTESASQESIALNLKWKSQRQQVLEQRIWDAPVASNPNPLTEVEKLREVGEIGDDRR